MKEKKLEHEFKLLLPEDILACLASCGWVCNGHIQAMASYENRVYQIGLDGDSMVVAKFYRPQRWSNAQILEEFDFTDELVELDLPVLTPMLAPNGEKLCHHKGFRFSVYPKSPGHAPYLDNNDQVRQIGRLVARLHNGGRRILFEERETFSFDGRGLDSAKLIFDGNWVPPELTDAYIAIVEPVLELLDDQVGDSPWQESLRLHGDMHVGNLLWHQGGPAILDFDDACNGPAIQDIWMFLSGTADDMQQTLQAFAEGYEMFSSFPTQQLQWVEAFRTLRVLHHTAWLARRWADPAFPRAFPWFNTQKFWQDHILSLKEQLALLREPPVLRLN